MALAKKIAYNVFFNASAKVISTVLALISIGFITRYLGKGGFGEYATVLAFFSFFAALADLGLYSVATREISRPNANEEEIMGNIFSLRMIISFFVLAVSPLIIWLLPYSQNLKTGIIIAGAAFFFSSSYMVLNGVFQKNLAMDKVATAELAGKILQLLVIILAVKNDWGFSAIISSLLFYMVFNFVVVFVWSRKYIKFKIRINFSYWKKFLQQSLPMGISTIITFAYFKADTILLSVMRESSDVGIYNAAYKVIENITFFPGMIMGLVLPLISHSIFTDKERFRYISDKTFKVFLILIVPVLIGSLFLADGIINVIGGAEFSASARVLQILVFALAFIFLGNFYNNILLAGNLQKKLMISLAICAAINICLNIFLIPIYSYIGAAITSVITELLVVAFTAYLCARYLKYKPALEKTGYIILSGIAMASFLFFFPNLNFFVRAFSSAVIYLFFLVATKAVSKKELRSIFKKEEDEAEMEKAFPGEIIN